jgi:hypothetical protein
MEESDRNKIIRNLVGLMRVENVSWLYSELISRNVYTPDMLEAIQVRRGSNHKKISTYICFLG